MRIVVTGAGGLVGTGLRPLLRARHDLVLIDRNARDDAQPAERWIRADINDANAIAGAMEGADAVLHLAAAHAHEITFAQTLDANYRGTIAVYDAALAAGVKHLVFASTNHGWGLRKASETPLDTLAQPAADGWYGISKLWGEAVTGFYAEAHGLNATSLRIGHVNDHVPTRREAHMWVSFRDFAALVEIVLRRPVRGHRVMWATAPCDDPYFDNSAALATGWQPRDRPEEFIAPDAPANAPGPEGDLGGAFANANRKVSR